MVEGRIGSECCLSLIEGCLEKHAHHLPIRPPRVGLVWVLFCGVGMRGWAELHRSGSEVQPCTTYQQGGGGKARQAGTAPVLPSPALLDARLHAPHARAAHARGGRHTNPPSPPPPRPPTPYPHIHICNTHRFENGQKRTCRCENSKGGATELHRSSHRLLFTPYLRL